MNRNLIAIAVASLGLTTAGAFANGDRMYPPQSESESSTSSSAQSPEQSPLPGAQSSQDSEIVKQVQSALSSEGYDPGPIDGQLSSQTQDALKQAQRDKGLSETGQIDSQTLAALGMGDLGSTSGSSSSSSSGLSSAFPESGGSEANGGLNGSLPS